MLLYVVESRGSSPGRQGFFMAVNSVGDMDGSIGGGIMEHKFVEMAKEKLKDPVDEQFVMVKKQVHDKSVAKDQSGMICSGEQINLMYRIQSKEAKTVDTIIECLANDKSGLLQLTPVRLLFSENISGNQRRSFEFETDTRWTYQEIIGYRSGLYIIGGGHCALALSRVMAMMNFHIHVVDTRPDLNTFDQNHYAHNKYILADYAQLAELVPSDAEQFIVVMTFGYRTDEIAVKALLSKEFQYFGLLGSDKKIRTLFSNLVHDGFLHEQVERIHAPVGLPINSQTPEEIAISIAAQIVAVKNRFAKNNDVQ